MIISHLVAVSNNLVIGVKNDLPWKLKRDLQHFSAYTQNKAIIMGRKTFESIGRPLPNRKNIVISKTMNGKPIKAMEHPGLWNGAMAFWNTLFVSIPPTMFTPVKEVNDLLRKTHQNQN